MGLDSQLRELYRDLQDAVQALIGTRIDEHLDHGDDDTVTKFYRLRRLSNKIMELQQEIDG